MCVFVLLLFLVVYVCVCVCVFTNEGGKEHALFVWEVSRSRRAGKGLKKQPKCFSKWLHYTLTSDLGVSQSFACLLPFGLLSFAFPQQCNRVCSRTSQKNIVRFEKRFASLISDSLNIILICFYAIISDVQYILTYLGLTIFLFEWTVNAVPHFLSSFWSYRFWW